MQAVILAAGRGKRLHPITLNRSKAMLPILGKPMVARIMDTIASCGILEFIVVIAPGDQQLVNYFQENPQPGKEIHFVEQPEPKGMAHALRYTESYITGDFLLSACDSLISPNDFGSMISTWRTEPQPSAILVLMPVKPEQASQTAIVILKDGWITQIIEKPTPHQVLSNIASLPIYLFNRQIFHHLSQIQPSARGELELQDGIRSVINHQGKVRGLLISDRSNLTSAQDLLEINLQFLKTESPQTILEPVRIGIHVVFIPPYYIGPGTVIGDQCVIGPNVYIESNCIIGKGCRISHAVLLRGTSVDADQTRENTIIFAGQSNVV
jgi:NDP-sugar pyrophosphorylase family protein